MSIDTKDNNGKNCFYQKSTEILWLLCKKQVCLIIVPYQNTQPAMQVVFNW